MSLTEKESSEMLRLAGRLRDLLQEARQRKPADGSDGIAPEAAVRRAGGAIYPTSLLSENVEFILVVAIAIIGFRTYFVQNFKIPTNFDVADVQWNDAAGLREAGRRAGSAERGYRRVYSRFGGVAAPARRAGRWRGPHPKSGDREAWATSTACRPLDIPGWSYRPRCANACSWSTTSP